MAKSKVLENRIDVLTASIVDALKDQVIAEGQSSVMRDSVSTAILAAIRAIPEVTLEADAVRLFGNGAKGKAHIPGSVKAKLVAESMGSRSTDMQLSYARRAVRAVLENGVEVLKDATLRGIVKAYDENGLAKTPKTAAKSQTKPETGEGIGHAVSDAEALELLIAKHGYRWVLAATAKLLHVDASTKLQASTLDALAA